MEKDVLSNGKTGKILCNFIVKGIYTFINYIICPTPRLNYSLHINLCFSD